LISTRLGVPPAPPPDREKMLAAAEVLERKLGILIRPLTSKEPWLAVNARLQEGKFGNTQLAELAPIAPALAWLDVGETAVTDSGLTSLAGMKNLRRLHLDRTAVTDAGLAQLSPLTRLELLNLHATKVTDAGLASLRSLPRLRSLYLWQTKVTPEAVAKFGEQQTDQKKIARWRAEVAALETRIRAEHFNANLGEALPRGPGAPAAATKTAVPMAPPSASATPPASTVAKPTPNELTPTKVAAKSPPSEAKSASTGATAPVNAKCPVLGEPVDANITTTFQGKLIAFCCESCREEFLAQPAKFPVPAQ
jgi:hypothetical protein